MVRRVEFIAGSLCLDLVDTIADRNGRALELLNTPEDLRNWIGQAGLPDNVPVDSAGLADVRLLRGAVFNAVSSVLDGEQVSRPDADLLNTLAREADFRPQFVDGTVRQISAKPFASVLSSIAADALNLLPPARPERLRRCAECGMLFLDKSRPGNRIWCSSATGCGNRAKVRRHRARKTETAQYER
ncbi:MAG: ABATE domain-containing protein [Pseudomonadota bacterium]